MQWLLLLSFCEYIIIIYSFKISWKWYDFVFSRQNYTENRWRCIGQIWLGILKKYFAWKLCIMKVCYGPNISSVWKSSMWTILHGFLADWLLSANISHQVELYFDNIVLLRYNKWKASNNARHSDNWIILIHVSGKSSLNHTATDMHLNTTGSYR